jgi:hypothetical protein
VEHPKDIGDRTTLIMLPSISYRAKIFKSGFRPHYEWTQPETDRDEESASRPIMKSAAIR